MTELSSHLFIFYNFYKGILEMLIYIAHCIFIPIVSFTKTCLCALFLGSDGDNQAEADTENPKISEENNQQKENAESPKKNPHQKVQRNYGVVYEIVKMACMNALQYLGQGTYLYFFFIFF